MTALSGPRGEIGASICTSESKIKCNLKGLLCSGDSDFTKWRAEDDNTPLSPDSL